MSAVSRGGLNDSVSRAGDHALGREFLQRIYETAIVTDLVTFSMESAILALPELASERPARSDGAADEVDDDCIDESEYQEFREEARVSLKQALEDGIILDPIAADSSDRHPMESIQYSPDISDVLAPLYGPSADAALAQRSAPSTPTKPATPQRPEGHAPRSRPLTGGVSHVAASGSFALAECQYDVVPLQDALAQQPPGVGGAQTAKPSAPTSPKASSVCSQQSSRDGQVDCANPRKHDQQRLRQRFLQNLQRTRGKEEVNARRGRVLQEYHWIMKDMQVERNCRKQEREWQRRQMVRREHRDRQRAKLLQQSDEALNLRYGRIMQPHVDAQFNANDFNEGTLTPGEDMSIIEAPIDTASTRGGDVVAEDLPTDETLELFVRTYREATGRALFDVSVVEEPGPLSPSSLAGVPPAESLGAASSAVSRRPSFQANSQRARQSDRKANKANRIGWSPGKAAWNSQRNPWRSWHVNGPENALPPMDVAVSSLLTGSLPPLPEGADRAESRGVNIAACRKRQHERENMFLARPRGPLPSVPGRCLQLHQLSQGPPDASRRPAIDSGCYVNTSASRA